MKILDANKGTQICQSPLTQREGDMKLLEKLRGWDVVLEAGPFSA